MENKTSSSYKQIVKSTGIFGGSQVINILIGIIRNKVIAVLLGATGIGLIGIYQSIVEMIHNIGGLGINMTGVKEIAASKADDKISKTAYTVTIIRKLILITSAFSALLCLIFCFPLSLWIFHNDSYSWQIASLSICILLYSLSQGNIIILQGLRMISKMAKVSVYGNFFSLLLTLPLYFIWGIKAIIPSLILMSGIQYLISHSYSNSVNKKIFSVSKPNWKEAFVKGKSMLRLGIFLVGVSTLSSVTMFFIRTYIAKHLGLESAGLFQSAWSITNIYITMVLTSMGSDYYPRLCAIITNRRETLKLINEQTYVAIIVATPIMVGMLLFGSFALSLLFSNKFVGAEPLLRWQILGTFLKVASWPMAFILLAKDKGFYQLSSDLAFYVIYFALSCFLLPYFGLDAFGVAFFIAYIIYLAIIYIMAIGLVQFRWTKQVIFLMLLNSAFIAGSFFIAKGTNGASFWILGTTLFITVCCCSLYLFNKVYPLRDLTKTLKNKISGWNK